MCEFNPQTQPHMLNTMNNAEPAADLYSKYDELYDAIACWYLSLQQMYDIRCWRRYCDKVVRGERSQGQDLQQSFSYLDPVLHHCLPAPFYLGPAHINPQSFKDKKERSGNL